MLTLFCDHQHFGLKPFQAGRAKATTEAKEERSEEGDSPKPVRRRHQAAGEHRPGLRHPGAEASSEVRALGSAGDSAGPGHDPPAWPVRPCFLRGPGVPAQANALLVASNRTNSVDSGQRGGLLDALRELEGAGTAEPDGGL